MRLRSTALVRLFISALFIATIQTRSITTFAVESVDCGPIPPGGTFDKTCKIQAVIPPATSLASEHQVFFDLHQAIGFLEAYKKDRCLSGMHSADEHLKILKKAKSEITTSPLGSILSRLEAIRKRIDGVKVEELESLREQLHTFGKTHQLQHEITWHRAFQKCDS